MNSQVDPLDEQKVRVQVHDPFQYRRGGILRLSTIFPLYVYRSNNFTNKFGWQRFKII